MDMDMSDTAQLEAQLAFLEDAVQTLDQALSQQQREILKLERTVELLRERLGEQGMRLDAVADESPDPPPPHY
jgi:SlyX protein